MDPRLGTRGSNDLGGALFKGLIYVHYSSLFKSHLFDSTKGGERKQEREDLFKQRNKGFTKKKTKSEDRFKVKTTASLNYKARSRRKLHQRRALSSLRFVILFTFGFYLSSSKRGRLLRQHYQDLLMF